MFGIAFSALFNSFFVVRIVKGPWRRNPQYLAVAMVGSILATLTLKAFWPGMEDSFIIGGLVSFGGSWAGMMLFDAVLSAV